MANDWFESGKAGTELTEEDVNRNWFNQGEPEWWKYNTADTTPYAETKTQGVLNSLAGGFYDSSRDLYGNAPAMMRNLPAAVRTVASAGVIPSWLPHPTLNPGGEQRTQLDEMRTELSRQSTMFPGSKEGQVKYSPQWFYENLGRMAVPMGTQVAVGAATGPAGYVGASFIQAAGGQYEQAFERNKQRGYSDEEAGKRASTEALAVGITSAAIDRFGYAWTLDKFKGKGFLKSVAEKLDGTPVARTIRGGLGELGAEGTQEGAALVVESIADMENYLTSENFWNRVVPNSILGFAAGSAVRGGVEAKGFATDTATVGARGDRKYSLTTEDAVKLARTDPVAATEIAKSSRAGVNDFARWGVERGQGNRKEATAQRKKFQEEVKRELDAVAAQQAEQRRLQEEQLRQAEQGRQWGFLIGSSLENQLSPREINHADVAQSTVFNPQDQSWANLTNRTLTSEAILGKLEQEMEYIRQTDPDRFSSVISDVRNRLGKRGADKAVKVFRQAKGIPQSVRDTMVSYVSGDSNATFRSDITGQNQSRFDVSPTQPGQGQSFERSPQAIMEKFDAEMEWFKQLDSKQYSNIMKKVRSEIEKQGVGKAANVFRQTRGIPQTIRDAMVDYLRGNLPEPQVIPRQQQEAQSVAQPAGPEASVSNPNQTDVPTADTQAPEVIDQTQTTEEAPVRAAEKMLARRIARALPGNANVNVGQVVQRLRQDPEGLKQELEDQPGAESLIQKIEGYQEKQVAQQERQPGELPVKNEGFTILPIPQLLQKKAFWNGVKSLMKSARSLGHRTKEHRQLQEQQFSSIHSQVKQSQWQARDFRQAMEEHYGVKAYRQIPMQERARILEALNTPAQLAALPDKIRIPMMAMRATIDALSQKLKPFLAKDLQLVIDAKTGMYTVRAYRVWEEKNYSIDDVPEDILRDGINYLQSISTLNVSDAEMRKLVAEYIASRGDKNFTIRGGGDSRVDMTSLLKRQEIPKELRNLMGEYTDPDAVFQHTVAKLATMAETFQFQQNIVDVGLNGNPDQKFLWRQDDLSRPDGLVKIEINESEKARKPLGAIAGLMTFPEVRDILFGRDKMRPHSWSMQGLAAASLATKLGKTVISPATSIRNVMSGIGFMVKNGHIFEGEAWKALWNEMSGEGFTVRDTWGANPTAFSKAKAIEYIEAGITGKEVTSNEIREMWELMSKQTATDNLFSQAGASNVLRQLSRGDDAAAELFGKWWGRIKRFYLNGDTLWKIVTYEGEKARLRKQGMTDEAAIRNAAAEITKNTTPDYDRVWGWVKPLRKTPLVATFPSFAAEMLRNNYEILKQGGYELREGARTGNRAMQVSGATRLAGLMLYTSVPIGASILASSLSEVSDEEDDAIRELDPPWMRNNFWFYVGRDEKTGQPIRFDITNLYTDQNIIKPMIALAHRGEPWEAAWEVVSPFFGWDLHTQAAIESVANVDFDTGRRISNPQASAGQQVPDRIWHYLSQVQPGLTQQGMQIVDSYNGKLNRDGKKVSPNAAWGRLAGVRFHSMDPETQIKYLVYGYRDATIHADSGFTSLAKEKSNPSKGKLVRRYIHMEAERRYVFDDMVNKVKAGVTLTDTRTVFDALGGHGVKSSLSKERKLRLIAGEYEPWQFDEDFIRAVPKENRQTVLEAIQEARQILANPTASRNAGGLLSPQLPPE